MGMFLIWAPLISVPYETYAKEVRYIFCAPAMRSLLNIFRQVYEFNFLQERCKFEIVVLTILLKSLNILLQRKYLECKYMTLCHRLEC